VNESQPDVAFRRDEGVAKVVCQRRRGQNDARLAGPRMPF